MKAKTASMVSKVLAIIIAVGGLVGKGAFNWNVSVTDIIAVALFVGMVFVVVDFSIILDKFRTGKIADVAEAVKDAAEAVAEKAEEKKEQ